MATLKVVINGAGAAGIAIARLLKCRGAGANDCCTPVKDVIVCDSKEILHSERQHLTQEKIALLQYTNLQDRKGSLKDALKGANVFIGVSKANLLTSEDIKSMADNAIVFALSNPVPEIMPGEAYKGGAAVVGTGRSDLPNQINNVLCFPGIFRGALDAGVTQINMAMKLAAAAAIADCVPSPTRDEIIPSVLDLSVAQNVAHAVKKAAMIKVVKESMS
jgi:malate dehydrogenase (oxaloacetate-decarboxylating)